MSSGSRRCVRAAIVLSTTAAGTINQTTLGFRSFLTRSSSEDDPTALSPTRSLTALGDLSKTTHSWPPLMRRRTMLAPILPKPTIPNCIMSPYLEHVTQMPIADLFERRLRDFHAGRLVRG